MSRNMSRFDIFNNKFEFMHQNSRVDYKHVELNNISQNLKNSFVIFFNVCSKRKFKKSNLFFFKWSIDVIKRKKETKIENLTVVESIVLSDNRDWYNAKQVLYIVEFKMILLRNFPFRQCISKLIN